MMNYTTRGKAVPWRPRRPLAALALAAPLLITGCGGGETEAASEPVAASQEERTSGSESPTTPRESSSSSSSGSPESGDIVTTEDGLEIEGILGSLAQSTITRAMQSRMGRFAACFETRYDAIPVLGGAATLAFRVRRDGSVRWVHLVASTVGDRETERCLLSSARGMRFSPGPQGGEAEFQDTLDLQTPDDVRPPVAWPASRVRTLLRRHGAALRACRASGEALSITAYVDPGGTLAAAGVAFAPEDPSGDSDEALDCVRRALDSWRFPDPGSYTAKVSFEVD